MVTDLYAFIATAVAGLIILATGFGRADAIATLVVVVLMLHAGAGLIRDSGRIFLEAAPAGLSPAAVGAAMAARPQVSEVHDLHIWEITSGLAATSAHVLVAPGSDCHAIRADLEAFLAREYGITHATFRSTMRPRTAGRQCRCPAADLHCDDAHGPAYRPGEARPASPGGAGTAGQPPMADMGRSGCRNDGSLMPWPGQLHRHRPPPPVGQLGVARPGPQRRRAGRSRSGRTGSCGPGRRRSAGPGRSSPQNGRVTDAITPTRAGPPSTRNASAGAEPRWFGSSGVRRELAAEGGQDLLGGHHLGRGSSRAGRPAASAR